MIDINEFIRALRLAWILQIYNENPGHWKSFLEDELKQQGGLFLLKYDYNYKQCKVESLFYKELIQ